MSYTAGQRITAAELNQVAIVPVPPTTATANGTASSGTTDTQDAALGVYQWTAVSGTRYEAVVNNLVGSANTVADLYQIRIRYSNSSATPTASSPAVAFAQWYCVATGGPGATGIALQGTFTATASGINTIALFYVRTAGTGVFTPTSGNLARELFVRTVGLS